MISRRSPFRRLAAASLAAAVSLAALLASHLA